MKNNIVVLFLFLFICGGRANAAFPAEQYLKKISTSLSNCVADYTMECTYPDGQSLLVTGRSATSGSKYFDSSNARFVLFDGMWEVNADHLNKFISVRSMAKLNKNLKGVAQATVSSFLFNGDFLENAVLKKLRDSGDTVWFSVMFPAQRVIERFHICFLRTTLLPVSYEITMNCPAYGAGDVTQEGSIHVVLNARNVMYPAPSALFDVRRVISVKGESKAALKRYGNYKTLFADPQQNRQ